MDNVDRLAKEAIITIKPESIDAGLNELFYASPDIKFIKWLDEGVGLIYIDQGFKHLAKIFQQNLPIFIQHIFPVYLKFNLSGKGEDLVTTQNELIKIEPLLKKSKTFSIQTRLFGQIKRLYKKFDINEYLAGYLQKQGFSLDVKDPQQIISVVNVDYTGYIGISEATENISNWAGGRHRFAKEEDQISRAEFKLLEIIDTFKINLPKDGIALDLGAAPGGWTRVLLNQEFTVIAVDPAELDPLIENNSNVTHFKGTTGEYFRSNPSERFDVIVNDMKMGMELSAKLVIKSYKLLKPKGIVIMTLKLPEAGFEKRVKQTLKSLSQKYETIGARQLFHNRSEITVVLRKDS